MDIGNNTSVNSREDIDKDSGASNNKDLNIFRITVEEGLGKVNAL